MTKPNLLYLLESEVLKSINLNLIITLRLIIDLVQHSSDPMVMTFAEQVVQKLNSNRNKPKA